VKYILHKLAAIFVVMLVTGSTLFSAAYGGENEKQKIIIEMFDVMQYGRVIDQISAVVGQQIQAQVQGKFPDLSAETLGRIGTITQEEFAKLQPDLMQFTGTFMVQNFSEQELVDLLDFYKSPAGSKSLSVMPQMMQQMMAWMPSVTDKFAKQTMTRVQAMLAEKGYEL
jgi:hypothetical protein